MTSLPINLVLWSRSAILQYDCRHHVGILPSDRPFYWNTIGILYRKLSDEGFHLISRLRDNANLHYLYTGPRTTGNGRPKTYDGKIDVKKSRLDRMERVETSFVDGTCYTLVAYAVALKRNARLVLYYPPKGACKFFFSTNISLSAADIVDIYRCRFQIEFCFRDANRTLDSATTRLATSTGSTSISTHRSTRLMQPKSS